MMPDKKKAQQEAKAKRGGARKRKLATAVAKAAGRSAGKASSRSVKGNARGAAKADIRHKTRSQTARNLESSGKEQMESGKKVSSLKKDIVTPRSAHQEQKEKYGKAYGGMSKTWRGSLPKKGKRKGSV